MRQALNRVGRTGLRDRMVDCRGPIRRLLYRCRGSRHPLPALAALHWMRANVETTIEVIVPFH
jgi:hypothetical protein